LTFSIVTRDELFLLDRHRLLESRLIHGIADEAAGSIRARDSRDDALASMCDREHDAVRALLAGFRDGRARVVTSAFRDGTSAPKVTSTIALTILDLSLVSTPLHFAADYDSLVALANARPQTTAEAIGLPLVWRNGSAAVLLHEAAGHPAEHAHHPLQWPAWLSAVDESDSGTANLLASECPLQKRRESFSDVPLNRMTSVVVRASGAQTLLSVLPPRRIDVLLVAGGTYEPLTEIVTLTIAAADFVDGDRAVRMRPFEIRDSRTSIARAIRGSAGDVQRYPGVICSREGQQLYVGSFAPDLVTEF
jgi:hypothetical protein